MGTYTFNFQKSGLTNERLLMFALPHPVSTFDSATTQATTALKLQTTTKGVGVAVLADAWTMVEDRLPVSMAFLPWSPDRGTVNIPSTVKAFILKVAQEEASQNMSQQSDLNSVYFTGKVMFPNRARGGES